VRAASTAFVVERLVQLLLRFCRAKIISVLPLLPLVCVKSLRGCVSVCGNLIKAAAIDQQYQQKKQKEKPQTSRQNENRKCSQNELNKTKNKINM